MPSSEPSAKAVAAAAPIKPFQWTLLLKRERQTGRHTWDTLCWLSSSLKFCNTFYNTMYARTHVQISWSYVLFCFFKSSNTRMTQIRSVVCTSTNANRHTPQRYAHKCVHSVVTKIECFVRKYANYERKEF